MDETDFVRNLSKAQFNNKHEGYFSRILRNLKGSSYYGENNVETEEDDENISGVLNFMNIYGVHTRFNHLRLIFNTKYPFYFLKTTSKPLLCVQFAIGICKQEFS